MDALLYITFISKSKSLFSCLVQILLRTIVQSPIINKIVFKAIPHNFKCRYGERGAADAKPKAQIILDVLSSILATQMPCRSRRSGARAVRRELCGIALTFCGYISCTAGCSPRPRRVRAGKQAVRRGLPLVPGIFKNFIPLAANSQGLGRGIKIHSSAS